jgi:heme exporter protein C
LIEIKTPLVLKLLSILSALAVVVAGGLIVFLTPYEQTMGPVQKVFYFHVASGWAGMASFLVATVFAALFLARREQRYDLLSQAGVEVGLVFSLINILTGMIWARPIWGTWWTWDPRLTTVAIMEMIYLAYLLLRASLENSEKKARLAAVYAIVGFTSVPLTFISIRIFRTIHPVIMGGGVGISSGLSMSAAMQPAFYSSLAAFSLLAAVLIWHRYRLGLAEEAQREKEVVNA